MNNKKMGRMIGWLMFTSGLVNNGIFASSSSCWRRWCESISVSISVSYSSISAFSSSSNRFSSEFVGIAVNGTGSSNELSSGSIWPLVSPANNNQTHTFSGYSINAKTDSRTAQKTIKSEARNFTHPNRVNHMSMYPFQWHSLPTLMPTRLMYWLWFRQSTLQTIPSP